MRVSDFPHSKHKDSERGVINRQNGHILWAPAAEPTGLANLNDPSSLPIESRSRTPMLFRYRGGAIRYSCVPSAIRRMRL
jgi:hypothetical protein